MVGTEKQVNKPMKKATAKIYCAACLHCKVFRQTNDGGRTFVRLVRCARERWKNRYGGPLVLDYHACYRRTMSDCPDYEETCSPGEAEQFVRHLFRSLPKKRVIHRVKT
jgi:hypothetical protein